MITLITKPTLSLTETKTRTETLHESYLVANPARALTLSLALTLILALTAAPALTAPGLCVHQSLKCQPALPFL